MRGQAMTELDGDAGAMASIEADREQVRALVNGEPVVIAGVNAPRQTVISGPTEAVRAVVARARGRGHAATGLAVSAHFTRQSWRRPCRNWRGPSTASR